MLHLRSVVLPMLAAAAALLLGGCAAPDRATLTQVAAFTGDQITGVAAAPDGRIFVNLPRWHADHRGVSVAQVVDGALRPYPDAAWNAWTPGAPPQRQFVCVQSVHVDAAGRLWVLDPASPALAGVVPGGAKLAQIDLSSNAVVRVIAFSDAVAPAKSYLNDVRVDLASNHAYITDSGLGGLVVVNLTDGSARRLLSEHPTTVAPEGFVPTVEGKPLRFPDGSAPRIHSDGLALDAARGFLYWQALTDNRLFRIRTSVLNNPALPAEAVAAVVEPLGTTVVTDGMEIDPAGRLYFSALERDAVMVRTTTGRVLPLVADPALAWPDSFAWAPDGSLLVTTAQIHRTAWFNADKAQPTEPYRIFRIRLPGSFRRDR